MQGQNKMQAPGKRPLPKRPPTAGERLSLSLQRIKIEPAAVVLGTFLLLQIFKLISLLITNKTVENILLIPFQLIIFLLPLTLYFRRQKEREYVKRLRLRAPRLYQVPLMLSALFLLISGNLLISLTFSGTGGLSEGFTLYNTFVSRNSGGFFAALFLIVAYAAVPAFCEELVFRAFLCREYEKYNVICGIAASSLFFALLHFDVYQLPVYLFSGLLLSLSMYATGSAAVPMAIHMAFNIFGLFGQPYVNAFYTITGGTSGLFIFILAMVAILSAATFCTFASKCYARRSKVSRIPNRRLLPPHDKVTHIISELLLTPFAIASMVLYIAVVIIMAIL